MLQNTPLAALICFLFSYYNPHKEGKILTSQSWKNSQLSAVPENSDLWNSIQKNPNAVTFTSMIRSNQRIHLTLTGILDTATETYKLSSLKVTFTNGRKQTILIKGNTITWSRNEVYPFLKLVDMNFDGVDDLQLFENAGATGNFWYRSWLYSERIGFTYSNIFSNLNSPKIDTSKKEIRTYYRAGYCEEFVSVYKVRGNTLHAKKYFFNENVNCNTNPDCGCIVYKKELIGKKWQMIKLNKGEVFEEYYNR